jgi:type II secretory pathway pseudopilin PulG
MKFFTKHELIGVAIILLVVGAVTLNGLRLSVRRARDAQRMADLGAISDALNQFYEEYGFFPPHEDGKIKACKGDTFESALAEIKKLGRIDQNVFISGLRACNWGNDSFADLLNEHREPYIKSLPVDPSSKDGYSYNYISNMKRFQIFAGLEGGSEEDIYAPSVVSRNLNCGRIVCSVGKAYADTPLDKTIEEYEEELLQKQKNASGAR